MKSLRLHNQPAYARDICIHPRAEIWIPLITRIIGRQVKTLKLGVAKTSDISDKSV